VEVLPIEPTSDQPGIQEQALGTESGGPLAHDHHYVPQFLLSQFTSIDDHPGQLRSFDRRYRSALWRFPKAVAWSKDFYTVSVPGMRPDLIERYFGRIEYFASETIRRIIRTRRMPRGVEYDNFMHFLALMLVRGPAFREALVALFENGIEGQLRRAASTPEECEAVFRDMPPDRRKPTFEMMQRWAEEERMIRIEPSGLHVKQAMNAITEGRDLLALRHWTLAFSADESADFICSDQPATVGDPCQRDAYPLRDLYEPGIDFVLPVNRKLALISRLGGRLPGSSVAHDVDRQVVAAINRRTMLGAWHYVYSPTDEFIVLDEEGGEVPGSPLWFSTPLPQIATRA
jgi:hypothetical protein